MRFADMIHIDFVCRNLFFNTWPANTDIRQRTHAIWSGLSPPTCGIDSKDTRLSTDKIPESFHTEHTDKLHHILICWSAPKIGFLAVRLTRCLINKYLSQLCMPHRKKIIFGDNLPEPTQIDNAIPAIPVYFLSPWCLKMSPEERFRWSHMPWRYFSWRVSLLPTKT